MTYAMMAKGTKLMPLLRHKPSQNPRVVYTLVDEGMAAVDALMRISSRTEGEFGSPIPLTSGPAVLRGGPPGADRPVERHGIDDLVALGLRERELGAEQAALRVEHVQIARHAVLIAHRRELERAAQRDRLALLRRGLVLRRPQRHQRVLHLTQRHQHRLLIAGAGLLRACPRDVDLLTASGPALREQRERDPYERLPDIRWRPKPLRELGTLGAVLAGEGDGRQPLAFRHADPCRGGAELRRRAPHVGALGEQRGGHAGGERDPGHEPGARAGPRAARGVLG